MVPRIVRVVLPSLPLVVTFMGFIKAPDRPAGLKVILIFAVFPGLMGLVGNDGRVHPHEVITCNITQGLLPVLVSSKVCDTCPLASLM